MNLKAALVIKIIFAVLIIFIVVEVVLGIRNLKQPLLTAPQSQSITTLEPQSGGKIALVVDKTSYRVGENINVAVRISTGGHNTDGTDLIINYDPNLLEASSSSISRGTIYSEYPLISVSNGKIAISGIASAASFNGVGVLANLNLIAKQTGTAFLSVDYSPESPEKTTDSNIIENSSGEDILSEVANLKLTIDSKGGGAAIGSCSDRVYTQCTDSNGKSGSYWCSGLSDGFSCTVGCFKEKTGNDLGCKVL